MLPAGLYGLEINGAVEFTPFPAPTKFASGLVNSTETQVSSVYFKDKILINITQGGRLSQWIQVPLTSESPTTFDNPMASDSGDMLPLGHLTPKTLLGAGGDQRETVGHLYATQIASTIATKNPEETRTVVVGLGLQKVDLERETFFDLLELLQQII
ncbi:hypothetical protein BJ878DRAFT_411316 [Calycina marina]|uniref:Proteasome assembly chaperone 3 n=1 Tax=Calycina marina TaxID=1763456 RepID=A0A9P7ZBX3_9HELO|nr:hypothetical protein BJ878DRAFT_411316 [Calycina marina]